MRSALIGHSGFVGTTLLKQSSFDELYRSTNIAEIRKQEFDLVVCAGAPAQKWLANKEPAEDLNKIDSLISHIQHISCGLFVLISTVDVFQSPLCVDENTSVEESNLQPYGRHRRQLETFVESTFSRRLIVRLPGLVGPGLKKNCIFDFLHNNNLHTIDSRGVFQFYPMVNLWSDIEMALAAEINLIHLTAEPISVSTVAEQGFGRPFNQTLAGTPACYDMRTIHAAQLGGHGNYQYSRRETLQAIRSYAQSEKIGPT